MASPSASVRDTGHRPLAAPAPARVWMDVTSAILGHAGPLSPLGADVLRSALHQFNRFALRVERPLGDPRNVVGVFDGRAWLNLSALHGYLSMESLGRWVGEVEPALGGHLDTISLAATDDLRAPHLLPGLMMQGARAMAAAVAGQIQPQRSAAQAETAWQAWRTLIDRRAAHPIDQRGLVSWVEHLLAPTAALVVHELMPRIALATTAARTLREPFVHRADCQPLLHALCGGLHGHRTTTMLRDLAGDGDTEALLERHGHNGRGALDVTARSYRDDRASFTALRSALPPVARFEAVHARANQARKLAVSTLASELTGPLDRARFLAAADVVQALGGLSDWPLDALLIALAPIRRTLAELRAAAGWDADPAWGELSLADLDGLRSGAAPLGATSMSLPGTPLPAPVPSAPIGLVGGQSGGTLARPSAALQPDRPVWVLDSLHHDALAHVASGVALVVPPGVTAGPALQLAAVLGRPCVQVDGPVDALLGRTVTVDGTAGTVSLVP